MTASRPQVFLITALVGSVAFGAASTRVRAQEPMTLEEAVAATDSPDRNTVEGGLQSLGLIGDEPALAALAARIRRGLPRELLLTAIFTVGAMGNPEAAPLLVELTTHRSADVRARAIEMIAALNAPGAAGALIAALSDPDPQVRAVAAIGLGDLGASEALDKLFQAQDRGVTEASVAIGKVVKAGDVPRLLSYLGQMPFRALTPALKAILARANVEEAARMQVVARLTEMATPEVKSFFKDLLLELGPTLPVRVRTAISTAVQRIAD